MSPADVDLWDKLFSSSPVIVIVLASIVGVLWRRLQQMDERQAEREAHYGKTLLDLIQKFDGRYVEMQRETMAAMADSARAADNSTAAVKELSGLMRDFRKQP